jgi:hypothetical protein
MPWVPSPALQKRREGSDIYNNKQSKVFPGFRGMTQEAEYLHRKHH